jgi:sec-independent protein translocase protein TatA
MNFTPLLALGLPSGFEWFLIAGVALVFFGPQRIPKLARAVGRSLGEFKKGRSESDDAPHEIEDTEKKPSLTDRQK